MFKKAFLQEAHGRLQFVADITLANSPFAASVIVLGAADGGGTIFSGGVAPAGLVLNKAGTQWKFKAPRGTKGITQAVVKSTKTAGVYRVTMKADAAWTVPGADETIATTNVTLQIGDECFVGAATRIQ